MFSQSLLYGFIAAHIWKLKPETNVPTFQGHPEKCKKSRSSFVWTAMSCRRLEARARERKLTYRAHLLTYTNLKKIDKTRKRELTQYVGWVQEKTAMQIK